MLTRKFSNDDIFSGSFGVLSDFSKKIFYFQECGITRMRLGRLEHAGMHALLVSSA